MEACSDLTNVMVLFARMKLEFVEIFRKIFLYVYAQLFN
jgi:hypothetical protein